MLKTLFALIGFVLVSTALYNLILKLLKACQNMKEKFNFKAKAKLPKFDLARLLTLEGMELNRQLKLRAAAIIFIISFVISWNLIISLTLGVLGFFLPGFLFKLKEEKALEKFNNQLIDALVIVSNSLRAGSSFPQALEVVVQESKAPLAQEFGRVSQDVRLGIPVAQALNDLSQRVKSRELRLVVTTINIARESGGNLAEILSVISNTMRERNKIQGKITALTAQGKLSGLVVGAMPFILMFVLYFMAPEIISTLFNTFLGNVMLAAIIVLVTIGGFVIKKIITIDI